MGGAVATVLTEGAKEGGARAPPFPPQLPQRAHVKWEEAPRRGGQQRSFLVIVVLRRCRPPDLFLPPSGARWRKPRRRPPLLPPHPVDAHDVRAFPPPVDARARPRLPIDDGGEVDGDEGNGGAALPIAKKSPSSSSSGALDGDAAEAEARRRLTSSRREVLGLYRDILQGHGSSSVAATPCNRRSTVSPRRPAAWSRPRRPSADASHRGGWAAARQWRTWGAAITMALSRLEIHEPEFLS
uniref:Uncharacterized protein n=1 Tax=Oryza meridionalis TaxID=40149 RepID=A0A0E0E743_9ORYZ